MRLMPISVTATDIATELPPQPARAAVSVLCANAVRNAAGGDILRYWRWRHARQAAWELLEEYVSPGDRVAIVGAGNGDDLPLGRLARRAGVLDLIDLDRRALRRARRRCLLSGSRARTFVEDVTGGAADAIVERAVGAGPRRVAVPITPVGHGRYEVVIADLFHTQLLYPALADSPLTPASIDATLLEAGQSLNERVTARLHAAAPDGVVIHLHDLLGWWAGHAQPFTLDRALTLARRNPAAGLRLAQGGDLPYGCDPRAASRSLGAELIHTTFWRWPFAAGTDYLVCATVARI